MTPAPPSGADLPECDLVMKGGITSGVVYPRLIAQLAEHYRFRSIGGSSAGAIAAAACAAAEHARRKGHGRQGFEKLAALPGELGASEAPGGPSLLLRLFQPTDALRDHFGVLVGALDAKRRVAGALGALLRAFWYAPVLAALVALGLLTPAVRAATDLAWGPSLGWAAALVASWSLLLVAVAPRVGLTWPRVAGVLLVGWFLIHGAFHLLGAAPAGPSALVGVASLVVVLLCVALALALAAWRFGATLLRGLHANAWGVCSGLTVPAGAPTPGLTPWLSAYFNRLAGLPPEGRPLTFGDLWGGDGSGEEEPAPADRQVNLEVMTTAVSQRMCFALPFRTDLPDTYYYDPREWDRLFPAEVMTWLRALPADKARRDEQGTELRPFPRGRDLPVVVAVRMSLSFPVLLSAVPLYSLDFSAPSGAKERLKRVWFSDGGIASNLPLHFFDAPLPGRPTFAVNLKPEHPGYPIDRDQPACAQEGRVYLPTNNNAGRQRYWAPPADDTPLGLVDFLSSIVDTMQVWRDESHFPYPGYRDRIVQVSLLPDEGGLNLNMELAHIEALADAGACAAERLVARFHPASEAPEAGGWENHEEVRLRTFLALAEDLARHPRVQDAHWDQVVQRVRAYGPAEAAHALHVLHTLRELGKQAAARKVTLTTDAPKPRATLRIAPRI